MTDAAAATTSREVPHEETIRKEEKGKAPLLWAPASSVEIEKQKQIGGGGYKRGLAIFDFVLRLCAIVAALAATATMATTQQTLPFFTQFFQFQASYDDLPTFQFFVIAMAIVSGYLILSIPFSVVTIIRPHASGPKLLLIILDTAALVLTAGADSSAAAIVYLAHNGNTNANWLGICQQFGDFCQRASGAVVASSIAVALLMVLVVLSAVALRRR